MLRFRDYSIQTKLRILAVVSSVIALALCCLGFVGNDVRMIKAAKVEECQALANMMGFNSTAVLSFHDAKAANELLQSLKSQPGIDRAVLFDAEGKAVAAYDKDPRPDAPLPAYSGADCSFTASNSLEIRHPIFDGGDYVGTLFLSANMNGMRSQLGDYAKISLFVLILSLNVVMFFTSWMQKAVARPVLELADTVRRISEEGDYSVRSSWDSEDEIGGLHRAFNLMLDQIETSESALQTAHDELEHRVLARTAELRSEIVEREKVQADLEHARDAAENANRAKSEFLANMSHEIRTPLNAVLGFTDLLQMGADDGDPAKRLEYLGLIHTSGEHLLGLINDILDLSKIESGRMEIERARCSPQQILADVVSVLRVRANEKGIALEYRWESGVPATVEADAQRLRQLLVNLVGNAIKFTAQGHVRVVGRMTRGEGQSLLAFDVIDTGVGIPNDKFDSIFDPFVQADNSVTRKFGGTGLGLAISRRIVEAMGGTLTLQSVLGMGSAFTATIDVGQAAPPLAGSAHSDIITAALPPPQPTAVAVARGRVLVVEDGDTNRKLIELILRRAGLEVASAENGKLGVDAALASPFDLILMDMQMPVMDGYTAARTLREHGLRLPIVALTAHAMSGDEQKCRAAGCSGFITKPIHADSLVRSVAAAIAEWQASQCAPDSGAGCEPAENTADWQSAPHLPAANAIHSELPTDDPDFREIVEDFVDRLRTKLPDMQQALAAGDLAELGRLAHWLKGSGGSAGFPALTAPAKHLETVVKDEQCDEIEAALAELRDVSARIVKPSQVEAMA
jgi:signal transduction histidine kinase/CheY-like chemotaxis protein/HPt (histidine-containing phosphotransfer) domain-containing protein